MIETWALLPTPHPRPTHTPSFLCDRNTNASKSDAISLCQVLNIVPIKLLDFLLPIPLPLKHYQPSPENAKFN